MGTGTVLNPNAAGKMTANVLKLGADEDEVKLIAAVGIAFESVGQCDKQDEKFATWRYTENGVRWKLFSPTGCCGWIQSKRDKAFLILPKRLLTLDTPISSGI